MTDSPAFRAGLNASRDVPILNLNSALPVLLVIERNGYESLVQCPHWTSTLDRASKFFSIFIWMISDTESLSRRIPTLVQYCQRGEFHYSDAVGILVLTGFLPFDSRFCSCRMFVLRFTFRSIQLIGGFSHQQSWRCAALPAGQTNTRELRCRTSP